MMMQETNVYVKYKSEKANIRWRKQICRRYTSSVPNNFSPFEMYRLVYKAVQDVQSLYSLLKTSQLISTSYVLVQLSLRFGRNRWF